MLVRVQVPPRVQNRAKMRARAIMERCFLHSVSDFRSGDFSVMFEFQNLEIYKKAKSFHSECRKLTSGRMLNTYVKDQLGRASFSIVLNIAEGSAKFSKADRRNYFITSRGSVFECVAILDILCDEGTLDKDDFECYLKMADELSRILYSMIANLSK
jgi:four helix bundle protein